VFLYSSRTLLISLFASLPNSPRSTESSERELSTRAPVAQECIKKFVYILITCTQMAKARCWPMQHGLAYLFDRAVTDRDPALAMRKGEKFAGYCPGRGCLLHPTTQSDGHTLALQDPKVSTDTHNNTSELNHMAILWLKGPACCTSSREPLSCRSRSSTPCRTCMYSNMKYGSGHTELCHGTPVSLWQHWGDVRGPRSKQLQPRYPHARPGQPRLCCRRTC
jgi:hypothetical protein